MDTDYIEVRREGKLLFRYNPRKRLVEIKARGLPLTVIDLDEEVAKNRGN